MNDSVLLGLGGVGLFLVGMTVLTDGLRALAGGGLRRTLARMTRSPASGALAGVVSTTMLQSSSATTVTTVGFVGSGLLTFPQAIGIVLGANIGSTVTGWLVALIGFRLDVGLLVLPLLLLGALLKLFGRGSLRNVGWALAGFSVLFLGVDALKDGLAAFEGVVTPGDFPDDTFWGRAQLVGIGFAITLVTQSSGAGVATALAAMAAGTISLAQGAALVIGMDVGTTATAVLAALGGSTAMRRTAAAHVVYNVMTAAMAFALLTPFAALGPRIVAALGDEQLALVAFHTTFNIIGVLAILPFVRPFSRLVERLVPEPSAAHAVRLDPKLLSEPAAALDVAGANARDLYRQLAGSVAALLAPRGAEPARSVADVEAGIAALGDYLSRLAPDDGDPEVHRRNLALRHALDHLARAAHRASQRERIDALRGSPRLRRLSGLLRAMAAEVRDGADDSRMASRFNRLRRMLRHQRTSFRERTIEAAAAGAIDAETTLLRLEAVRWLHRVTYHFWRISHHLARL